MPRVYSKKAAKDYPEYGIVRGTVYYEWKFRNQRPRKSATRPTRAQLTNSSFLQTVYGLYDGDLLQASTPEEFREVAQALRDAGEECQGSLDNMPDSLQYGPTGEMLQTRIDSCEEAADEIESAADTLEEELARIDAWEVYINSDNRDDEEEPDGEEPEDLEAARGEAIEACREECSNEPDWG